MIKKKIISFLILGIITLSLSSCTSSEEELIDIHAWKDKLKTADKQVELTLPDTQVINGSSLDIEEILGATDTEMAVKAEEMGNSVAALIKQWSDAQLIQNFPSLSEKKEEEKENGAGGRVKVELLYCVDGDTIIVEYENEEIKVRLIGVNTPESVAGEEYLEKTGKENTQEGKEASAFLKDYLADKEEVWLEFDLELYDDYGRLLAYVWLNQDGTNIEEDMLNAVLIKLGYAEPMTINPNKKYETEFTQIATDR